VVGISVDSPGRNAAMVDKLRLPFPLLADPGGRQAIRPYGVWQEGNPYARPAVVIVAPGGRVAFSEVGEDFADRLDEDEVIAALALLGLPPVTQDPPRLAIPSGLRGSIGGRSTVVLPLTSPPPSGQAGACPG
jgi:hypothetical protein